MARNIEIKAKVRDPAKLKRLVEKLSDAPPECISQEDIFFHSDEGRLKLRILAPDLGEMIFYERANVPGPRASEYRIYAT